MAPKRTKAAQKQGRKKKRLENPATSHTDISQPQNSDASQSLTLPSSLTHEAIVESVIAVLEQKGVIPRTEQTAIPANSGTMTPDQLTTNSDHASCSDSDTIRQVQQALCPTTSDTSEESVHRGSILAPHTTQYSGTVDVHLNADAKRILSHALSDRTKLIYFNYWKCFVKFCQTNNVALKLPVTPTLMVNFLTSLVNAHYRMSTILGHVSSLSYINKLFGYSDFNDSFLVKQFIKGANNMCMRDTDSRLPITLCILQKILLALPVTIKNFLHRTLFSTMCIFAFHGFLRIGEMCLKGSNQMNMLQFQHVKLIQDAKGITGVELHLQQFKHSSHSTTIFLPANPSNPLICPVTAINLYLKHCSPSGGPFFQMPDGQPVSYSFFNHNLNNAIAFIGLDPKHYKSHSFRIGAATHAIMQGFSEHSVQKMGRWKSNALQNYIRIPQLKLQ